ncbi:hypothetical protein [Thiothrix lacustris]|uniref:Organic solvent tolerance-like N-terminal domain-containing protein n=1 Tax=Thiothrix lacustris TaxID=525917 RepID=A0ABY9MVG3_9GAMM|nr:hypothetical protein [Thiothrix lacustris]WML91831.1 hypothetical protein RCF98_05700 [Thiothrix lacustris]WMP16335.1 hypothetical protein RCS87_13170 [Thiothrix lacustris]
MKRIAALSAMLVFASASAFATEVDIDMLVHDVEIYQAQDGTDLTQRAVISHVNDQFDGRAKIYVHNSKIYQKQKGQNGTQSATIATICDCDTTKAK